MSNRERILYRTSALLSLSGIVLILGLIYFAVPTFKGFQGESYSFVKSFISELGNPYKNTRWQLLNMGLKCIAVMFFPSVIMLSYRTKSKVGYLAGFIGFLAMIALFMVGVLPEHFLRNHTIAAFSFFILGAIAVGLFSLLGYWNKNLHKGLIIPSALPFILFIIFLVYPKTELHNITSDPHHYIRPNIVGLAVLEWLFFLTMSIWIVSISIFLLRVNDKVSE